MFQRIQFTTAFAKAESDRDVRAVSEYRSSRFVERLNFSSPECTVRDQQHQRKNRLK